MTTLRLPHKSDEETSTDYFGFAATWLYWARIAKYEGRTWVVKELVRLARLCNHKAIHLQQ